MEIISQSDAHEELKVTFYPELYLQRRVWILNFLRREGITRVSFCSSFDLVAFNLRLFF